MAITGFRSTVPNLLAAWLLLNVSALAWANEPDIDAVAARADVQHANVIVDALHATSIEWLVRLTQVPAPPFEEQARAEVYMSMLKEIGVSAVAQDEEGNVIARIPGRSSDKNLALVAHLDTVFPAGTDVTVHRDGDKYCAPGVGDNSRGLVAMLVVAKAIVDAGLQLERDLVLIASVGEEGIGDLRGMRHLLREGGPRLDEFVVIDGARSDRLTTTAVGSTRYRLVFAGAGGHSWGAFGLANPAQALSRAMFHFDEAAHAFVATPGEKVTYNIGRIGGGTSVNSIPFENWAEIDMRSTDPARLTQMEALLTAAVARGLDEQNDMRLRGDPLTARFEPIGSRPAGSTSPQTALVRRVIAAMHFQGIEPDFAYGSTDANIPIALGIPAVTVGAGGIASGSHSLHECWQDQESDVAVKILLLVIAASL